MTVLAALTGLSFATGPERRRILDLTARVFYLGSRSPSGRAVSPEA